MSWGAVISTGVGVGASLLGSGKTSDAAGDAADREQAAADRAVERTQDAFETSEQMLAPFAEQEYTASNQMMAQLGLGGDGGGGGGGGRPTSYASARADRQNLESFDNVVREMMAMAQVRYKRSGYNGSNIHRNAAQFVQGKLDQMQKNGQIPQGYKMPGIEGLTGLASQIEDSYGGHTKMAKNLYPEIQGGKKGNESFSQFFNDAVGGLTERYGVQAGDVTTGQGMDEGAGGGMMEGGGGGSQVQTAADIMERAGLTNLPPELREKYMGEVMRDAETDPALAEYLGLTPESMDVGSTYQQNPAYMRAIEEGTRTVNQGAAGSGSLYSGRRGEALRDVGQTVDQNFYFDAADRQRDMMGRRAAERGGSLARMGVEYGAGLQREQSAYNNYMQMLNSMSSPTTATNIEGMRQGAATGQNATLIGTARNVGDLEIGAAGAEQAALADIGGGLMEMGSAFIDREG